MVNYKVEKLRKQRGNKCLRCGKNENLHFAHLTPTKLKGSSRGSQQRYYDIKKYPKCYVLLCREDHRRMNRCLNEKL